jgi:hypothetical protein
MAANDYTRTVNITPLGTSYSWDTPPSWITITRQGTSNDWTITVAANSGAPRSATLTVRHDNTSTTDTIQVTQAGIVSPTSTPVPTAVPTATPVPTATATPTYSLSFVDESFFIDDYNNGAGYYVDLVYNISGTTSAPVLVEKDSRISWTNRTGPIGGVGTLRIYSEMPAAEFPISAVLSPDFKISHPLNSSVVASIPGTISQAQSSRNPFENEANPTPVPNPTATEYYSGGGGGGGCHIAGEIITMANGETKAVENIQIGDQLLSFDVNGYNYDEEAYKNWSSHIDNFNGEFTSVEVTNVKVDTYSSYYNFNEGLLKITYEHPILIKDVNNIVSWKTAKDAVVGEYMLNENNQWVLISTKLFVETETPFSTWTLDVETEDVYFANGILVHNAAPREIAKDLGDSGNENIIR